LIAKYHALALKSASCLAPFWAVIDVSPKSFCALLHNTTEYRTSAADEFTELRSSVDRVSRLNPAMRNGRWHGPNLHNLSCRVFLPRGLAEKYGAGRIPASQRLRDTTAPTPQPSKTSGGLTKSQDDCKTDRAAVSPTFHTIVIDFHIIIVTIHTGWYVGVTQQSETQSGEAA